MTIELNMKINLNDIWSRLESQTDKNVPKQHVKSVGQMQCFIGFVGHTNSKLFQCDIPKEVQSEADNQRKFRGVDMYTISKHDSKQRSFIILLAEEALEGVFTLFIEDLLKRLDSVGDDESKGFVAINKRIDYWQRLFEKVPNGLLSREKQRGLYGELYVLKTLLNEGKNPEKAIKSWVGAEGLRQDFLFENNALEIKTQLIASTSISISNEFQLDYTVLENLYLSVILLNESKGNENTIYQIIYEIQELLVHDFELMDEFKQKLAFLGITEKTAFNHYNQTNFSVKQTTYYKIDDGFPLLINPLINNDAIYSVRYKIHNSSCAQFKIDKDLALAFLDNYKSVQ